MKRIQLGDNDRKQVIEHSTVGKDAKLGSIVKDVAVGGVAGTRKPSAKRSGKRNVVKIILVGLILFVLVGGGALVFSRWQKQVANGFTGDGERIADACVDILNPSCWTEAFTPQLRKTDGKTSALIVGIDTRASGSGSGLANTDTIILATLDHNSGHTRLISFPRDLYAPWGCSKDNLPFKIKINAVYYNGGVRCKGMKPIDVLALTIEKITGETIHYKGIVKLEGLVKVVDELGGITVNVDPRDGKDKYVDVYPYIELSKEKQQQCKRSRSLPAYCEFSFNKGPVEMNGELALIYSRMRQYSDDFDRGRRQQHVIKGIKDKVLGKEMPTAEKARFLLSLYSNLGNLVEAEGIDIETILGAFALLGKADTDPISVVMDPRFGGGGLIASSSGNYQFSDYSFKAVQNKLKVINDNYGLYKDKSKVYGLNLTGKAWTNENPVVRLKGGDFRWIMGEVVTETKAKPEGKVGIEIIDYSGGSKQATIDWLKQEFGGDESKIKVTVYKKESPAEGQPAVANAPEKSRFGEDVAVYMYEYPIITAEPAQPEGTTE